MNPLLSIKNLHVEVGGQAILQGIDLEINEGEIHAVMGPNGSGKSTLANVLAGREGYQITRGEIVYNGQNLVEMAIEDRAKEGIFLAHQYPVEIPGVSNINFLKAILNAKREHLGEQSLDAMEFLKLVKEKLAIVGMSKEFLSRFVNQGFSGGEKKRNEILQMIVLEPRLAVIDEIDSGLDIDAMQVIASGINCLRDSARAMLMITHYQRLLSYVIPDHIHVLAAGKIVRSGDKKLAHELEKKGYAWLAEEPELSSHQPA